MIVSHLIKSEYAFFLSGTTSRFSFSGRLSALRHKDYFRYWSGSFASVGATMLQTMAQGWLLFELTDSVIMLGYLGAAASIPTILMTLFGGALADRINKRHVLMTTSISIFFLLALLALLDATAYITPWGVIAIAAVVSVITGFDWPTRAAIFPHLINKEDMMSAVALNSIIWQSSRMVMPMIGGFVIALVGTWLVFALCALGFLSMFFVMAGLKIESPKVIETREKQSTLEQVKEGLSFIIHNKVFLILISLSYAAMFFGMSHMQLMPAFSSLLEAGEQGYGLLLSATGVGAVVGTILIGSYQDSKRLGHIMLGSATMAGLSIFVFAFIAAFGDSFKHAFFLAIISILIAATFNSMFMISSMTVLQLRVPDHLRGRVMGFHGVTYSMIPLGGLSAGFIASISSPPTAIAISTSLFLLFILYITISRAEIRKLSMKNY
ncbi:MAG: MFS transporter [Pseudomonadales bacterium]|nr:MFS transporter [Pseudomonadales bacterium]